MKVSGLSDFFEEKTISVLEKNGISELNPMQSKSLKQGLLSGEKNMVVSSPTASGKTLVAQLAILKTVLRGKKALYVCPLRALASEQHETFKKFFEPLGVKVGISIGDLDSRDPWLRNYDVIVSTQEKSESLIRHKAEWIPSLGLLVVDEIHQIGSDRGPVLEILITRLRHILPKLRVLALSATIPNAGELADWLDAELVESDYRPIPLYRGVYFDGEISYEKKGVEKVNEESSSPEVSLVLDTLGKKGQVIVFATSRRSAEAVAKKLAPSVAKRLSRGEKEKLSDLSQKVLAALESPTSQCRLLSELVARGVSFHHAGLVNKQRKLVEDAFKNRLIKVISATPTLAQGVNLPSTRVVLKSVYRYEGAGSAPIPVNEYLQQVGRAGRPGYDEYGEGVLLANDDESRQELWDRYILGDPEDVFSHLASEPVLRTHVLASIALGFAKDWDSLRGFFSKTFYAHQYRDLSTILEQISSIERLLEEYGFVENSEGNYVATRLGSRVSQLYIDPESAHKILVCLKKAQDGEKRPKDIAFLHMVCDTDELRPWLDVRQREEVEVWGRAHELNRFLFVDVLGWDFDDHNFLEKFKTALLLSDWIQEFSEEELLENYRVAPGILRAKLRNAEWMLYAAQELAKVEKIAKPLRDLGFLGTRVKYGVREELLPLVELKGIGRVRARRLFKAGFKTQGDLKKADVVRLSGVIGSATAVKVKKQLGIKVGSVRNTGVFEQSDLSGFSG